ncbi:MAG: hypothetical protein GX577_07405 [Leptolinea sp.]|nr:hypothetical protein [Leptolinea sp.]
MLYSFNMNFRSSITPEEEKNDTGITPELSIFLQELSPFGFLLAQIIRMTGWLFPGNILPAGLNKAADYLESPETDNWDVWRLKVDD